eukprot:5774891-Pleurochrysis_carterae.AAC.2
MVPLIGPLSSSVLPLELSLACFAPKSSCSPRCASEVFDLRVRFALSAFTSLSSPLGSTACG